LALYQLAELDCGTQSGIAALGIIHTATSQIFLLDINHCSLGENGLSGVTRWATV
jgi:methylase of polypeptide subunit release factors